MLGSAMWSLSDEWFDAIIKTLQMEQSAISGYIIKIRTENKCPGKAYLLKAKIAFEIYFYKNYHWVFQITLLQGESTIV